MLFGKVAPVQAVFVWAVTRYVFSHEDRYEEDPEFDRFCDVVIDAMEKAKAEI